MDPNLPPPSYGAHNTQAFTSINHSEPCEPCSSNMIEEAGAVALCAQPPLSPNYEIPPPMADFSAPPPYEVATKLPTYDEVQQEKRREGEMGGVLPTLPIVMSFLFNWIGFLLLMCFCHTIAARYGALSGFGLSLSKWTLIVKHSSDVTDHVWLYWLVMSFGLLICIRAIVHYLNIKRGWQLLSGNPHAQERLLFFY
ncbi:hypothetical protein FOCC_FOCC001425 [Frankliniella occidentalis]|nr:hypothetical protein FOCC_FOCC001425 [Frankliniella occidentalis]